MNTYQCYILLSNIFLCNTIKSNGNIKIAIMITFSNNMEKWVRGVGNMEFQFMGGIDIFILLSIAFCINELFPKQWENKY